MIAKKAAIKVEQQALYYEEHALDDDQNVAFYDICDKSMLKLVINKSFNDNDAVLVKLLKDHNLYDHLYEVLCDNAIDLDMLLNDVELTEIDEYATEFNFNLKQKIKFRKLIRIIDSNKKRQQEDNLKDRQQSYQELYEKNKALEKLLINPDHEMTVVLVGDMGAGKSSLMQKYCKDIFNAKNASTLGVDQMYNLQKLSDGTYMQINIWDTAGQERLQSIGRQYYRRGHGIIICYDLSLKDPFQNFEHWRDMIEEYGNENAVVIMVGCKYDLSTGEENYKSNTEMARKIIEREKWKKFNTIHCECSAKTVGNIFIDKLSEQM